MADPVRPDEREMRSTTPASLAVVRSALVAAGLRITVDDPDSVAGQDATGTVIATATAAGCRLQVRARPPQSPLSVLGRVNQAIRDAEATGTPTAGGDQPAPNQQPRRPGATGPIVPGQEGTASASAPNRLRGASDLGAATSGPGEVSTTAPIPSALTAGVGASTAPPPPDGPGPTTSLPPTPAPSATTASPGRRSRRSTSRSADPLVSSCGMVGRVAGLAIVAGTLTSAISSGRFELTGRWPMLALGVFVLLGGIDARRGSRSGSASVGPAAFGFAAVSVLVFGTWRAVPTIGDLAQSSAAAAATVGLWGFAAVAGIMAGPLAVMVALTPVPGERRGSPVLAVPVLAGAAAVMAGAFEVGSGHARWAAVVTTVPEVTATNLTLAALLVAAALIAVVRRTAAAFGLLTGAAFIWTVVATSGAADAIRQGAQTTSVLDVVLVAGGAVLVLVTAGVAANALRRAPLPAAGVAAAGAAAGAGGTGAVGATALAGTTTTGVTGVTGVTAGAAGAGTTVLSMACAASVVVAVAACAVAGAAAAQPGSGRSDGVLEAAYASIGSASYSSGRSRAGSSYRSPGSSVSSESGTSGGTGSAASRPGSSGTVVTVPCPSGCGSGTTTPRTTPPTAPPPTPPPTVPEVRSTPPASYAPPTGPPEVTATAYSRCPARNCKIYLRVTPNDDLNRPASRWIIDGDTIDLYCQADGQFVRDNDTGRTSTVWYQTKSGDFISGIYLELNNPIRGCSA